jgi:hypothetical protein
LMHHTTPLWVDRWIDWMWLTASSWSMSVISGFGEYRLGSIRNDRLLSTMDWTTSHTVLTKLSLLEQIAKCLRLHPLVPVLLYLIIVSFFDVLHCSLFIWIVNLLVNTTTLKLVFTQLYSGQLIQDLLLCHLAVMLYRRFGLFH